MIMDDGLEDYLTRFRSFRTNKSYNQMLELFTFTSRKHELEIRRISQRNTILHLNGLS